MKLYVKPGRRYRSAGKEYGPGEAVDVSEKFVGLLSHQKGPLQKSPGATTNDAPAAPDDLHAARAEYEKALNRRPYHGWDAAELRSRINTYRTTHMTAG